MDRWSGVLKVPLHPSSRVLYRVAASLRLSPTSKALAVASANVIFFTGDRVQGTANVPLHPSSRVLYRVAASLRLSPTSKALAVASANVIFFTGDRVQGTGNSVIDRLSNIEHISEILVSKFGGSINAWVVEASTFNGPFAVYKDFIPSVDQWGDPKAYTPIGFPASTSTVFLLSNCLEQVKKIISGRQKEQSPLGLPTCCSHQSKTFVLGFSKGGTVLNQLVTELSFSRIESVGSSPQINTSDAQEECQILPNSNEGLLNSIAEIHYVDVGLNSAGAYITDEDVICRISRWAAAAPGGIRFVIHGTPRQWCDERRVWVRNEKDKLVSLLESEAEQSEGKLRVCERFYFSERPPNLQMHFEIIENLDVS